MFKLFSKRILFLSIMALPILGGFFILVNLLSVSVSPVLAATPTCTDSDAQDKYTKGVTYTCDENGDCTTNTIDFCSGDVGTEYYCDGTTMTSTIFTCAGDCLDGRCFKGGACASNLDCKTGQFCELDSCGGSTGTCADIGSSCSTIYDPTCGCNDTSYSNSCERQKASVSQKNAGRCGDACIDSDDGKKYTTLGTIDGYDYLGTKVSTSDTCVGDQVKEYYCSSSDIVESVLHDCANGCQSGKCIVVDAIVNTIPVVEPPMPAAGTLDIQPGWLIKNMDNAEVFYVESDLSLRWVVNEQAAIEHFGSAWNQNIKEYDDLSSFGLTFGDELKATDVVSSTPEPTADVVIVNDIQPGWLVKNNVYTEVFYVSSDLKLQWIVNEVAAVKHFGPTWSQDIKEFDDLSSFGLKYGTNLD